jgi:hypothetical protein
MLVSAALLLASCSAGKEWVTKAENSVVQLHSSYNAKDYSAIYQSESQRMRGIANEEQVLQYFSTIRSALGEYMDSKVTSYRYFATVPGPP